MNHCLARLRPYGGFIQCRALITVKHRAVHCRGARQRLKGHDVRVRKATSRHERKLPPVGTYIYHRAHSTELTQHGGVSYPSGDAVAPQRSTPLRNSQNGGELAPLSKPCDH
jgi:hypothetical protein